MVTSKSKDRHSDNKNTKIILCVLGCIIVIVTVIVLLISQPQEHDYLTGKYEKLFKDYTYDCMDFDELGDVNANSVIGEIYGPWALVACTCSYVEFHNHYGDKEPPKTEVLVSALPLEKKTIYDAASVFLDKTLEKDIKSCIEKEQNNRGTNYGN